MKFLNSALWFFWASILSFSNSSFADVTINKLGVFQDLHPIVSFGYSTAKACEDDGGVYDQDGHCTFKDGGSTIVIDKNPNGKYYLSLSSVGTNMHTCDYQGEAQDLNAFEIISMSAPCEVTISYAESDSIAVITNGKCQDYCGAFMTLDVGNALPQIPDQITQPSFQTA